MTLDVGFGGIALFTTFFAIFFCWPRYRNWRAYRHLQHNGVATQANLTSASVQGSSKSQDSPTIEYWFIPQSSLHIYRKIQPVDPTTFERYRCSTEVPILYLADDPDTSDIVGNDHVIWGLYMAALISGALIILSVIVFFRGW